MKSLLALALAALALPALALSCAVAGDEDAAVERTNPEPGATEEYWTPERLRGARPLPLPHPTSPPPRSPSADAEPPSRRASVSEAGSPGSGDVAPDESNYLFPSDLLPHEAPAPK